MEKLRIKYGIKVDRILNGYSLGAFFTINPINHPNNRVEPIKVSNNDNFLANDYGVLKGQMLNIADNGDTSISALAGDPGRSKTPIGIRSQNATEEPITECYLLLNLIFWSLTIGRFWE